MTPKRARLLALAAGTLLALALAPQASAQVSSGPLRATVAPDPWTVTLTDAAGATVLREHPGLGVGPSGTLGFRVGGGWFHATRVATGGQVAVCSRPTSTPPSPPAGSTCGSRRTGRA